MKNDVLEKIKNFSINELKAAYGYCGVAESDNFVMINSDDKKGEDIKITIKAEQE